MNVLGPSNVCLGNRRLCGRTFDTVALAGTHNSMNAATAGFLIPEHRLDIGGQLDAGIRALLIDTHPGRAAADGIVWTDINLNATEREPGATPYSDTLAVVRRWLLSHRGEIIVLFVQDESSQADNIAAIRTAGLESFTFRHRSEEPWPTLRNMIRDGQRLVVFAEHHGGGASFYRPGFPQYQDTSFDVPSIASLNCGLNRGNTDSPLFLLNHWIETELPSPDDAEVINQKAYILERARKCRVVRGRAPNIIAVDFSDAGDVRGAVDELNNGPRSEAPK